MNVFIPLQIFGEVDSHMIDVLDVDGVGGSAQLIMDSMGEGEAYAILFVTDFPSARPRYTVAAETRVAKVIA